MIDNNNSNTYGVKRRLGGPRRPEHSAQGGDRALLWLTKILLL